ncbi:unnamed protein product [Adineta steineri]|uniref:Arf-GAP domain-containing protein n=1 Tax=Adineta steineri TaxID=433720 RepID=A0A813SJN8_9BILA|nr:unnamed protein product [Adineta steineri]
MNSLEPMYSAGLGVSLSKVRSLHMDSWDLETLLVMSELGNTVVNDIYEVQISNGMQKPNAETDAVTRRAFIEAKYVQKAFLHPLPSAGQARASTRKIKRWIIKKNSIANDTDDDTIKTPNRQLMTKRTTPSPDHETVNQDNSPVIWDMNIYLYEAAHQQNVMMMLHALALEKGIELEKRKFIEEHVTEAMIRKCPRCTQRFYKVEGCNKMTCSSCGLFICYVCRETINGYDHFTDNERGT